MVSPHVFVMILTKNPLHAILSVNVLNYNTVRLGIFVLVSTEELFQNVCQAVKRSVETWLTVSPVKENRNVYVHLQGSIQIVKSQIAQRIV